MEYKNNKTEFTLIYFADAAGKFAFCPNDLINESGFKLYCFKCKLENAQLVYEDVINGEDLHSSTTSIMDKITFILSEAYKSGETVYTVHSLCVLLEIYKLALLKNIGKTIADELVHRIKNRVIDICEAFHSPSILSIDRRKDFSCETIRKWMDFCVPVELGPSFCNAVILKELCRKLFQ